MYISLWSTGIYCRSSCFLGNSSFSIFTKYFSVRSECYWFYKIDHPGFFIGLSNAYFVVVEEEEYSFHKIDHLVIFSKTFLGFGTFYKY